jgi:hypothetical protein
MHSLTSALDGGAWSASRPDRFTTPGKNPSPRYLSDRRPGGLQIRFGHRGEKKNITSLPLVGNRTPIASPYPSHCTERATPAPYPQF